MFLLFKYENVCLNKLFQMRCKYLAVVNKPGETNATIVTVCSCFPDNELHNVFHESVLVQLN